MEVAEQEVHSLVVRGNSKQSEKKFGMLGRIRATPRWADDFVWDLEILGRIQTTPRWEEDLVRWLS